MDLTVNVALPTDGEVVLTLSGAIDLQSRDVVIDAAREAIASTGTKQVTLDLAQVSFIDSSGIGALIQVAGDAQDAGIEFGLRDPSARVVRVLEVTGLIDFWRTETTGS
jgi:anti-anti-sigma factor